MRDILNRMLQTRQQEALAQAIEEMDQMHQEDAAAAAAAAAATALSDPVQPTAAAEPPTEATSQILQPLAASQTRGTSAALAAAATTSAFNATSQAQTSSASDFTLPPLQRMGVNYAELPAFLMNMVDFNGSSSSNDSGGGGHRLFRFGQQRHQHAHGSGSSGAGSGGIQRNQEYTHNHFALDDWNQLPSSRMDLNSDNDDLQFVAFSPIHQYQQQPRFNHQLQLRHLQQQSAAARLAASSALGPFTMMSRAPPGPPQEIDLTVSSSESDDDDSESDSHGVFTGGDDDDEERDGEDEDGEVEIVHTRTATPVALAVAAAIGGGASGSPSARYLTYTSVPPLRRKRRRQGSGDGTAAAAAATADDPVNPEMFDGQRAESTNISMENNETIERFKKSLKCSICLDVIEEMTSTICGHVYCGKCIRLAIRVTAKCPLCQRKLRPKDVHPLYF